MTISLRDAANKVIDLRPGYATGTQWTKFSANLPATASSTRCGSTTCA